MARGLATSSTFISFLPPTTLPSYFPSLPFSPPSLPSFPPLLFPFLPPLSPPPRLGGYPPFSDEITEYSLRDQICQARYSFPEAYWKDVSPEGLPVSLDHVLCLVSNLFARLPLSFFLLFFLPPFVLAIDLIKQLLTLNPKQRITTVEALHHHWMQDDDVIARAKALMGQAPLTVQMPPPPKPVCA